jgi:predicted transcriptional regulator
MGSTGGGRKDWDMMVIHVPDKLSDKINEMAEQVCQTPEEYILEIIAERIEHDSAYRETAYLAKSEANRKRLDDAVRDIRSQFGM